MEKSLKIIKLNKETSLDVVNDGKSSTQRNSLNNKITSIFSKPIEDSLVSISNYMNSTFKHSVNNLYKPKILEGFQISSILGSTFNFFFIKSYVTFMQTLIVVLIATIGNNVAEASQRDPMKVKSGFNKAISINEISNNNNAVEGFALHEQALGKKYTSGKKTSNVIDNNYISINHTNESKIMEINLKANTTFFENMTLSTLLSSNQPILPNEKTIKNYNSSIGKTAMQKPIGQGINFNSHLNRNSVEILDDSRNGPFFDKTASKNVTALLGKTAYLNCRVKNLGNKTMLLQVSWVRHRDIHLLTVGRYTYTSDQRFRAIHQPQTEDWILQIKYPQHRDSGIYECQVSTTPHMSHYIHLNVVEPSTEIVGAPDLYIESGSTINLTCVVLNSPEPPAYIFWNHNDAIINYDSPRGGVSVLTIKGETTTSFLLIKSAKPSDSGHYQCNPSNAKPKLVTVHVLNGEIPAAMQRAGQAHHHMSRNHYLLLYVLIYFSTSFYVKRFLQPPSNAGVNYFLM